MSVFGVTITKVMDWRGQPQQFSNVYHFNTSLGQSFDDVAVINAVKAAETPIHSNQVSFLMGRTWGPTDQGVAASKMREVVDLSGTGTATAASGYYRELAHLIRWPLGRYGSKNRPQYLRKWLHCVATHGFPTDGTTAMTTVPSALQTYIDAVTNLNPPGIMDGPMELCTAEGKMPTGPGKTIKYLEHRQLGR